MTNSTDRGRDGIGRAEWWLRAVAWRGLVAAVFAAFGVPGVRALPSYDDVLVVINLQSPDSVAIGRYFQQSRRIPERNICPIWITPRANEARMTVAERNAAVAAVQAHLDAKGLRGRINYIVLTKDIAYFSDNDMLGVSGDNHLFDMYLLFMLSNPGVDIFSLNPFYHYADGNWTNLSQHAFTRTKYGFPIVTRLDGPGAANIRKMIDATGAPAYQSYTNGIRFLVTYTNDAAIYRTNATAHGAEFIARGNILLNEAFYRTPKGAEYEPVMDESDIMFAYFNLVNEQGIQDPPFVFWKLRFLPGSMITCFRSFPTLKQFRSAGGVSRVIVSSKARTEFRRADGADLGYLHTETIAIDPVRGHVWCGSGQKQQNLKVQFGQYTHQRRGGGLALLDATNGALIAHFTSTNSALLNDRVVRVAYDRADDRLWVASYGGIQYVDLRDRSFHTVAGLSAPYAAGFDVYVSPFRTNKVYASFLYEGSTERNSTIAGARTNVFEIDKPTGSVKPLAVGSENGFRPLIGSTGPDTLWVTHNRSAVRIDLGTGTVVERIVLSNVVGGARLDAPFALLGHTNSVGERQLFVAVPTAFGAPVRTNYLIRIVETGPTTSTSSFTIPPFCIDTNSASSNQYHYVRHLVADPLNPDHVYAAVSKQYDSIWPLNGLVLRSTDGRGASWETWLASSAANQNLNEIAFDGLGQAFLAMGYHNSGQGNISDFAYSGACAWGGGLSHDNMVYNRPVVAAGVTLSHWNDSQEIMRVKPGSATEAYTAGNPPLAAVMFKTLDGYGSAAARFGTYLQYPATGALGYERHMLVIEPKVAPYAPRPDMAGTEFRPGPTNQLGVRLFSPGLPATMDGFDASTIGRDTVALFDAVGRRLELSAISYDAASQQVRCVLPASLSAGVYHMLLRGGVSGIKNRKGGALLNTQPGEFRDDVVLRFFVGGAAGNDAPVVDAGPDVVLQWPQATAALSGTVSDDGQPSGAMTVTWTKAAGPGVVSFSSPNSTNTTATFETPGVYILRLTADDGNLAAADEVLVTVRPERERAGLIAQWEFEEAAGTSVADTSGNGYNATMDGVATRVAGRVGKAVRLNGTNAVVAVTAADGFDLTERFTITAWVLPEEGPTPTRGRTIASRLGLGLFGRRPPGWHLGGEAFNDRLSFTVRDRAGVGAEAGVDGFFASHTGKWTHVAAVFDGGKYVALYTNGTLASRSTDDIPPRASYEAASALSLGRSSWGGDTFAGCLDDVRIYDRALGALEIAALHASAATNNAAPIVSAGAAITITWPTNRVLLAGQVLDDGRPASSGAVLSRWSLVSGPASPVFTAPDLPQTGAIFPRWGTYVLRLAADDGEKSAAATVTVTVASSLDGAATNYARGQATVAYNYSISEQVNGHPSKAVDGNRTNFNSKWWANSTSQPRFWQTALGGFRTINEVHIYNQDVTGTNATLFDFEVRVHRGGAGYLTVGAYTNNTAPLVICRFDAVSCSNVYLSITRNARDIMVYEVEAYLAPTLVEPAAPTPSVALTSPADGAVFTAGQVVPLAASVADVSNVAARVEFYAGALKLGQATSAPYAVSWTNPPAGTHRIKARVVDVHGRDAVSSARNLTVNCPPTAAVASPRAGAIFLTGETFRILAAAGDADGSVTNVAFFVDGSDAGAKTMPPFERSWNTATVGPHSLRVTATDDRGATAASPTIEILVTNAAVAPAILVDPAHATVAAGSRATFSVTAMGTTLSYQWRRNGVAIPGATNDVFTTLPATAADHGTAFSVAVTNSAGSAVSGAAVLSVVEPPEITQQPSDSTIDAGQRAEFFVTAAGAVPLHYQWRKNGTNIAGATQPFYLTPPVTLADSGALYDVVVSNSIGLATSDPATLTVTRGMVAHWKFDEVSGVTAADSSGYARHATVSNGATWIAGKLGGAVQLAGSLTQQVVALNVAVNDQIGGFNTIAFWMKWNGGSGQRPFGWNGPYGLYLASGAFGFTTWENNIYGTTASGLTNQWVHVAAVFPNGPVAGQAKIYIDGEPRPLADRLTGVTTASRIATTNKLLFSGWGAAAGQYFTGALDDAQVFPRELTAAEVKALFMSGSIYAPVVTSQPTGQVGNAGQPVSFTVTVAGSRPMSYQWYSNRVAVLGATNSSHVSVASQDADGAEFFVIATNVYGATTSAVATLSVRTTPTLSLQPSDRIVHEGLAAAFSALAAGTAPLVYQWFSNGVAIVGATGTTYTTPPASLEMNGGLYWVVVTNMAGSIASSNATLFVTLPPSFISAWSSAGGSEVPSFSFGLPTLPGHLYDVLVNDDLTTPDGWVVMTNGIPGTGGTIVIVDPNPGPRRFYRIRVSTP